MAKHGGAGNGKVVEKARWPKRQGAGEMWRKPSNGCPLTTGCVIRTL
jgi:hypothetical protein